MEEEKSWVYTLVLGVCMLLSLALIGRMLIGHPHSADRSGDTAEPDDLPQASDAVEWTADDLSEMTAQALPFTADDLTVQISRAGTVTLELTVSKTALSQIGLLEGRMRTALLFLPEELRAAWTVAADADGWPHRSDRVRDHGGGSDAAGSAHGEAVGAAVQLR